MNYFSEIQQYINYGVLYEVNLKLLRNVFI